MDYCTHGQDVRAKCPWCMLLMVQAEIKQLRLEAETKDRAIKLLSAGLAKAKTIIDELPKICEAAMVAVDQPEESPFNPKTIEFLRKMDEAQERTAGSNLRFGPEIPTAKKRGSRRGHPASCQCVACSKPPRYRAFKDEEEFKPHRDRWYQYNRKSDTHFRHPVVYNFIGVDGMTWNEFFKSCSFEDGTPCGVQENP